MAVQEILLLGNPKLYETSPPVKREELDFLREVVQDLHDTLMDFRSRYEAGRAIAAPQIEVMKRVIYMHIDKPVVFINPRIDQRSPEMIQIWDDCMSFPDLLVKVQRHKNCRIKYKDIEWKERAMILEGDLSELLQHECDHLDGVLAVSRAVDKYCFALKSQRRYLA
ncbi:MAG: peptide deformylase [Deltaproteobacteria bacterium]|jgi:peptide deformylase|nr:MAG: peptide deformylase [Deltaproteobacteria bacterium]